MDVFLSALEAVLDAKGPQAQRDARAAAERPQQQKPPKAQPKARAETGAPLSAAQPEHVGAGGLLPLFEDGKSLIRAIVAAEVLGPPVALREPSPWSQRPNEPSI